MSHGIVFQFGYQVIDPYMYLNFWFMRAIRYNVSQVLCTYGSNMSKEIVLKCYTNNDPEIDFSPGVSVHLTNCAKIIWEKVLF